MGQEQGAPLGRGVAGQVVRVVVAQLEEALDAGAAVVRALPLQAVRQHQHQPALLAPALLSCRQPQSSAVLQSCLGV